MFQKRLRRVAKPRGPPKNPGSENPPVPRQTGAFAESISVSAASRDSLIRNLARSHEVDAQRTHCNASPGSRYLSRRVFLSTTAAATANSQASRHSRERAPSPSQPSREEDGTSAAAISLTADQACGKKSFSEDRAECVLEKRRNDKSMTSNPSEFSKLRQINQY